jgi:AraC family transcriptional regulator of arabinose operon
MMNSDLPIAPTPVVPLIIAGSYSELRGYRSWRPKGTQDWLMIGTIAGSGRFRWDSQDLCTEPFEIILLRPGMPHDCGVADEVGFWKLVWAHFHPRAHWYEWLNWQSVTPGMMRLQITDTVAGKRILDLFEEVFQATVSDRSQREARAMNRLELILLECMDVRGRYDLNGIDSRVESVRNYIAGNVAEPISVPKLARISGLSVSRIGHLFKTNTGLTPQHYWEQQKMIRAQQLLYLTDRSIQAVATEVGFDNPYYFSNRFKIYTGMSPTIFRQSYR